MTVEELILLLSEYKSSKKIIFETPEGNQIEEMVVNEGIDNEIVISEF